MYLKALNVHSLSTSVALINFPSSGVQAENNSRRWCVKFYIYSQLYLHFKDYSLFKINKALLVRYKVAEAVQCGGIILVDGGSVEEETVIHHLCNNYMVS